MRSFLNSLLTITFALLFFYGCEVEEKKNIYQSPALQKYSKFIYAENFLLKDKASKINKDLSGLLGIEADFLIENKVSFNGKVIDEFIDCGKMNDEIYVNYIDRIFGSYLEATITFEVTEESNNFKITNKPIKYVFYSKETGTRWKFKTNKPKELLVGNPVYDDNPYRTCISKNILEKKIINIFNEI